MRPLCRGLGTRRCGFRGCQQGRCQGVGQGLHLLLPFDLFLLRYIIMVVVTGHMVHTVVARVMVELNGQDPRYQFAGHPKMVKKIVSV